MIKIIKAFIKKIELANFSIKAKSRVIIIYNIIIRLFFFIFI